MHVYDSLTFAIWLYEKEFQPEAAVSSFAVIECTWTAHTQSKVHAPIPAPLFEANIVHLNKLNVTEFKKMSVAHSVTRKNRQMSIKVAQKQIQ